MEGETQPIPKRIPLPSQRIVDSSRRLSSFHHEKIPSLYRLHLYDVWIPRCILGLTSPNYCSVKLLPVNVCMSDLYVCLRLPMARYLKQCCNTGKTMSLEHFDCPMCGSRMGKAKVKASLKMVLEDSSTGEFECPVTICMRCHNMQLFPDVYRKDKFHDMLKE